ncbi:DNA repair protein RecN [Parvimonas micra]|uniref:DNA repair protein RecN n=2 Tax=Parvimonas micra TaxID=33033 RepID=A0A9X3HEI9_9FIRM|nr:DNA repair protein RecN [Parvimonas micra]MCZ7407167.1 DNA repair protein RecN [Parvimonas micra]MCZ7410920.1 DNA repair protein RecN [Parvimonas micra]MCZ7411471.1 DNA repair protein RecN [Parvimonas micra]WBB37382.1 DNA repair protein RecN [Parvimonas micra]
MLSELYIRNLAIVDEIKISFTEGLNILTGETGTGKSIIIGAISLLCGGRANTSSIGKRSDTAYVEGVFFLSDYDEKILRNKFDLLGLDIEIEDNMLVISRNISKNGRSVSKINNRTVNNSILSDIMLNILNVCGQHDSYTLFNRSDFVEILDSFCDDEFRKKLKELEILYDKIKKASSNFKKLKNKVSNFDENVEEIKSEIEELNSLELETLDEEFIENEIDKFNNSQTILGCCGNLVELFDGENLEVNAFSILNEISRNLVILEENDKNVKFSENFENISFELRELFTNIQDYYSSIYIDEESLTILQEKFNLLNDLKRKHKTDKKGLIKYKNSLEEDLYLLEHSKDLLFEENNKLKNLSEEYKKIAIEISNSRKEVAKRIEKLIEKELLDLDLKNSIFKIDIKTNNKITNIGFDEVTFLISTNKGEELQEIYKIASGGELSRIMLGFKKVLSDRDKIATLVFDEIDTGISGITAQIVGEKLAEISKNHQLLVISHLPQISVLSDTHFIISKETVGDITLSKVLCANYDEKVMEISRLIGGANINETTIRQSKEMIEIANEKKERLRCIEK